MGHYTYLWLWVLLVLFWSSWNQCLCPVPAASSQCEGGRGALSGAYQAGRTPNGATQTTNSRKKSFASIIDRVEVNSVTNRAESTIIWGVQTRLKWPPTSSRSYLFRSSRVGCGTWILVQHFGQPLYLVPGVKLGRIQSCQHIATHSFRVFKDKGKITAELKVWANKPVIK